MNHWAAILALASLPLIGAFNGWVTTYLAIRMLFRPRRAIRVLGFTYVAPLPRRQAEIAQRVGEIVEAELLSYSDIRDKVVTPEMLKQVEKTIERRIGQMLAEKRASLPHLAQKFVNEDLVRHLRKMLAREVSRHLPQLIDQMFELLAQNVSMKHLVTQRVAAFELERLEEVIFSLASKELRLIELFCGGLGMAIGFVQLLLTLLVR